MGTIKTKTWIGFKWANHGGVSEVIGKSDQTGMWIFMHYVGGIGIGGGAVGTSYLESIRSAIQDTATPRPQPQTLTERTTLGERIKYLRISRNWSLRELSEATGGTSKGYLSEIERGNMRPTVTTLDKLAKAFDMSPAVLLGGQDSELTADEQELLDAYRAGDKLGAITIVMAK